jgi:tripeptide aminopeptidase
VPADPSTSDLARQTAPAAVERLVRYARVDTQADPASATVPSTARQLDLSRLLVEELRALGLSDAVLDEQGFVMATLPATVDHEVPTIALLAHVDVAPDAPAAGVRPQVVRYPGGRMPLPGDPSVALDPAVSPALAGRAGQELVTSDGTTLLGADDKAGIAEIMTAVAHLVRHPEIPHGPVRVCFTRDEEVGRGVEGIDLARLGAQAAYTLDGADAGTIEDETFNARSASVTFRGVAVHPGYATGRLVNALKVAADFVASLPRDGRAPETTAGREGFIHPVAMRSAEDTAQVDLILRDFDRDRLDGHERLVRDLAARAAAAHPGSSAEVAVADSYRNMKEYLREHPGVVARAEEAIRRAGLEPRRGFIRGGTDGARLSELGLPTPNLFTGQQDIHSRHEWIAAADMGAAVATLIHLVQIWAEPASPAA